MSFYKALKNFTVSVLLAMCIFPSAVNAQDNTGKLNPYTGLSQEEKNRLLYNVCARGKSGKRREAMVRLLLEAGADGKSRPADASCPMVWYVLDDHDDVMEILCEYGTDVSDPEDRSILNFAAENKIPFERIKLLVEQGADLKKVEDGCGVVYELINYGYQVQDVEWMLDHGAPVQTGSGKPDSTLHDEPLCSAIEVGNLEMMKLLVNHGADIKRSINGKGDYPLNIAAKLDSMDALEYLYSKGCRPSDIPEGHKPAFVTALIFGKYKNAAYLLKHGDNVNRVFFDERINAAGRKKEIPVRAIQYFTGISYRDTEFKCFDFLLEAGADVLAETPEAGNEFTFILNRLDRKSGKMDGREADVKYVVQECLKHVKSKKYKMPAAVACIIDDAGALTAALKKYKPDADTELLYFYAYCSGGKECLQVLKDAGFKPGYFDILASISRNDFETAGFFIDNGPALNDGTGTGFRNFIDYCYQKQNFPDAADVWKFLFGKGLDVNCRIRFSSGAESSLLGYYVSRYMVNTETMSLFIQQGADVNETVSGKTALMNAVNAGNEKAVLFLLSKGADPKVKDGQGDTVLYKILNRSRYETVRKMMYPGKMMAAKNCRLYESPYTDSKSICEIKTGQPVEVLSYGDYDKIMDDEALWLRINVSNNQGTYTGWVFGAWLR